MGKAEWGPGSAVIKKDVKGWQEQKQLPAFTPPLQQWLCATQVMWPACNQGKHLRGPKLLVAGGEQCPGKQSKVTFISQSEQRSSNV